LTSIRPDKNAIAETAVELLMSRINTTDLMPGRDMSPGFDLVVRESAPT
jgi:DNA-binding LacI/PurR family transcriptional regulator